MKWVDLRVVFPDKRVILIQNPHFGGSRNLRAYTDSFTKLFTTVPQVLSTNFVEFFILVTEF